MRLGSSLAVVVAALSVSAIGATAGASFLLTYGAPGEQSSTVPGVVTETFESFSTGNYTALQTVVGPMTSPGAAICDANQWGGAGGTGRYLAIGAQSGQTTALFEFGTPQSYIGVWLSAMDAQNGIELISGGSTIARLDITALSSSLSSSYRSNPNNGQNSGESYAYLNFFATSGTTFDAIKFVNRNTGTGLEFDNLSIRDSIPGTIPGTPVPGGLQVIPEPAGAMVLLGPAALLAVGRRRNRASPSN